MGINFIKNNINYQTFNFSCSVQFYEETYDKILEEWNFLEIKCLKATFNPKIHTNIYT